MYETCINVLQTHTYCFLMKGNSFFQALGGKFWKKGREVLVDTVMGSTVHCNTIRKATMTIKSWQRVQIKLLLF